MQSLNTAPQKRKNSAASCSAIVPLALVFTMLGACSEASTQPSHLQFEQVKNWHNCPVEGGEKPQKSFVYFFENSAKASVYLPNLKSFSNKPDAPLVLIGLGQRPSGGYGIQATKASLSSTSPQVTELTITAEFMAPSKGQMTTMALTAPCTLIQFDKLRALTEISVNSADGKTRISQKTPMQAPPQSGTNNTKPKTQWTP